MKLLIVSTKKRLEAYMEFAQALEALKVETTCVSDVKYCSLFDSRILDAIPVPKLPKLARRVNPDFILTDTPYYVPHMGKLAKQRVLLHMRGDGWTESLSNAILHPSLLARVYTHYLHAIHTTSMKKVDLILPSCKWLQQRVEEHLPNHPTQVLHTWINTQKWRSQHNVVSSSLKHPAVVGVFPCTIYPKVCGLLKFIKAIRKMPGVNFYFAGGGPYLNLVERKRPPNMCLLGRLPKPEVQRLLSCCDVFVHPSGLDAIPRGVMEASLMQKPIVASSVGGIPEIIEHNLTGYLCKTEDTDEWIRKIRYLLDNPRIARRLGRNAREFVAKTFSLEKIASDLLGRIGHFAA